MRSLVLQFLSSGQPGDPKQIIVLGAGFDTTYFQLAKEGALGAAALYIELDFEDVTRRKTHIISSRSELQECLSPQQQGGSELRVYCERGEVAAPRYRLQPVDLRRTEDVEAALARAGADLAAPTLILAECVLVYMDPAQSSALLRCLSACLPTAAVALYEQVNPADPFGLQMMLNLAMRGCPLLGILPTLDAHAARLRDAGWARAEARSMADLYRGGVDPVDRRRIERLEMFDEFEEWNLIQEHYCVALGVNSGGGVLEGFGFRANPPPPAVVGLPPTPA